MQVDRHSRLISWLKVGLPLAALALLSTLFLLSRSANQAARIPFADVDVQARLRDQQVTGPFFSGTTPHGDEITFQAERLTTPAGRVGVNQAVDVRLRVNMVEGTRLALLAKEAAFDLAKDQIVLSGDVIINTSSGYDITSKRITGRVSRVDIISPGKITARTPGGHLTAGAMRIHSSPDGAAAQLLFSKGVKLLYRPKQVKD